VDVVYCNYYCIAIYGRQFVEMSTTENAELLQSLKKLEIECRNRLA
jgi:hypothetical protein